MDSGALALAKEALVLSFKLVGKLQGGLLPVLIIPSDKTGNEELTQSAYDAPIQAWSALGCNEEVGKLLL